LLFHPADPTQLLFATNVLWKTTSGGDKWEIIRPDLTRKQPEVPASIGDFMREDLKTMRQRAVIYSVAPSPLDKNVIWVGTDDGLVHVTRDGGKTWKDVTPPALKSWDKISQFDAGHYDANTAYFSVNAIRKDDMKPHIYRTHDGGATWQEITNGMSPKGPVNAVREDPKQAKLLFASTEREVYFSIDDGDNWQSLRRNMPATSVRDIVIHDDDLVAGTHGRSIWILDNISPLRNLAQVIGGNRPFLFPPAMATRVRHNMFGDTPLPPEEPAGQNPPDGTTLDYWLPSDAKEVKLEILGAGGEVIRSFSSSDALETFDTAAMAHPTYWIRPAKKLSATAGHHRFVWDLRYTEPKGAQRQLAISANYKNTATGPQGPFVQPGNYRVKLTVDGQAQDRTIVIRLDPRVKINESDLKLQADQSLICYRAYSDLQAIREQIDARLADAKYKWPKGKKALVQALRGNGSPENPDIMYGSISETAPDKETIVGLQDKFLQMMAVLQSADVKPTTQAMDAVAKLQATKTAVVERWGKLK